MELCWRWRGSKRGKGTLGRILALSAGAEESQRRSVTGHGAKEKRLDWQPSLIADQIDFDSGSVFGVRRW
jgi:hypothetical protein